jgi:Rrf2 family cysteine metabolism transcriptional repressor
MKVSSRAHYGLRAMTELAKTYGQGTLSLSEIAAREHMPLPYLEQVIGPLRRARLVEGTRGVHGGYRLARAPSQISVGEVVRVLDGPDATAPVECVAEGYVDGTCIREADCLSRPLWSRVKAAMDMVLFGTTLADLCSDLYVGKDVLNLAPELMIAKESAANA